MRKVAMTLGMIMSAGLVMGLGAAPAGAQAFDPREWKGRQAGAPTLVLTLGTFHLSQAKLPVREPMMSAVLDKLAVFHPDLITVEQVSGEQCDLLQRFEATYPESFKTWCRDTQVARKAVGLDAPSAAAEIRRTLAAWPANPAPAARRRLAAVFLAAGDWPSAVVQWRRLPPEERHPGDGLTAETLAFVERRDAKPNETYDLAVALAVRLGLERVYLVDDHTSDGALADEEDAASEAVQAAWRVAPSKIEAEAQALEERLKTPGDVLDLYRLLNRPDAQREAVQSDFAANLAYPSPRLYGRHYVSGWQVRNLRMVANIEAAAALHPGARVLNIVGASHKPYYDAYLNLIHDVELVDAEKALK